MIIEGTLNVKDRLIQESINLKSGEPWDTEKIAKTRLRLLRLGLFERVYIGPLDGELDQEEENLLIRVVEKSMRTLEVGGGYNSALGVHVFGAATDKLIFGDGRSLSLRLDTYYDEREQDFSQGIANCLLYTSPSPRDATLSRMPSSA